MSESHWRHVKLALGDAKWFLVAVLAIATGFAYSPIAKVTPEPNAAIYVYANYVAMTRVGADDFTWSTPWEEVSVLLDAEQSAAIAYRSECVNSLESIENNCQLENKIEADARLQHWKSYALPSFVAAATVGHEDLSALRSLKSESNEDSYSQVDTLQPLMRELGLRFFSILFLIKVAVFFVVWAGLRRYLDRLVLGLSIVVFAVFGILVDAVLRRGQGLYPLDRLVAGSSLHNPEVPITDAILQAVVDVGKGIVVPIMSSGPLGNSPRGIAVFIAFMMLSGVLLTKSPRFLLLIPIGLSVHFTTFGLLVIFLIPAFVWSFRKCWRSVSNVTIQVGLYSLPLLAFQLGGNGLTSSKIGFWVGSGTILLSTLVPLVLLSASRVDSSGCTLMSASESIAPPGPFVLTYVSFLILAVTCMVSLAFTYRHSDSINFWTDGFRRESVGRVTPLVWSMSIYYVCCRIVSLVVQNQDTVKSIRPVSFRATWIRLVGGFGLVAFLLILIQSSNSRTFL